jgi:hypothetical protein
LVVSADELASDSRLDRSVRSWFSIFRELGPDTVHDLLAPVGEHYFACGIEAAGGAQIDGFLQFQ